MIDVYASLAALLNHPLTPATVAPDSRDQLATFLGKDNTGCDYVVQQNLNNTLSIIQGNGSTSSQVINPLSNIGLKWS